MKNNPGEEGPVADWQVADAMVSYGGSFVSALGRAFQAADLANQERIKHAFHEYWVTYTRAVVAQRRTRAARPELET